MADVKLDCKCYIAIRETTELSSNKNVGVRWECLTLFNCMQKLID